MNAEHKDSKVITDMKIRSICVSAAVLCAACSQTVLASDGSHDDPADNNKIQFSGNVTLITDYDFRGVSQSHHGPAIQGGVDAEYNIFYVGAWASSVELNADTSIEIDFYGGVRPKVGDTEFDFGVIYYTYPDAVDLVTGTQNFVEFYAGISHAFGPVVPSMKISYSPDYYGETDGATYLEGEIEYHVIDHVSVSAGIGSSMFENDILNNDYVDYNVGIDVSQWGFDFDLRFHTTSGFVAGGDDGVVVFSISRSL